MVIAIVPWDNWTLAAITLLQLIAMYYAYNAAKKSSDIAANSLDLSRESSQRSLRAYVGISNKIVKYHEEHNLITVSLVIKNSGQTPAYDLSAATLTMLTGSIPPHDAKFDCPPPPDEELGQGVLQPGSRCFHSLSIPISPHEWRLLKDGQLMILFVGDIHYTDVFNKTHRPTHRMVLKAERSVRSKWMLWFLKEGNEANDG